MSELKACPFCGGVPKPKPSKDECWWYECGCKTVIINYEEWNTRPIEDDLRSEIARLSELLHDEMSQLEIATELGNKRWVALNDIYENGEKHNANWCKRKAQEGLGIK